jgi:hypothetical protein
MQRTIHGNFALRTAADGTDLALHAWTVPFRAPLSAEFARIIHAGLSNGHLHRIVRPASYDQNVARTDVYLKVELDLDPKEKPERVAAEICRTIRRIYGVRKAEVSSMVERDES